jgi:two-component system OmpR family response regulator
MLRILNINDDSALSEEIIASFRLSGFNVDMTRLGLVGVTRAISHSYDVVVLGEALPDLAGSTVISALRGAGVQTPVIMVSSTSDFAQRAQGLRAGADDYISMPFSQEEMLARMEVLVRERVRVPQKSAILRTNALQLDLIRHIVTHGQRTQRLLPKECRLLEFMMRHVGRILTRSEIFEAVWDHHFDPGTNLIDVHVGRLRRKLSELGLPPMIFTIRGSGYRFQ